jgi:uncharacterized protein YndB with AHSA1/START domain
MSQQPLVVERVYQAPIEKVWQAITDNACMKQWYFNLAEFKPEVGFEFTFTEGSGNSVYTHHCKVTEVVPGSKLSYSWQYETVEGLSFVTFELFPESEGQTRLKLTHTGLETFRTDNPDFARESFLGGWTYITGTSLKNFLEA